MMLVIAEEIPLTIVWKVLVVVEMVLELMIEVVALTPLVELVNTLAKDDRVFEVTAVVVDVTPFTDEVRVLAEEERELVVLLARWSEGVITFKTPSASATTMLFVALPACRPSSLAGSLTPATCNLFVGTVVPIPTDPSLSILTLCIRMFDPVGVVENVNAVPFAPPSQFSVATASMLARLFTNAVPL